MSLIDFFIGFFLVNAMPHFLVHVFQVRFLSLFGLSPQANIAYSFLCFVLSVGLFLYHYGWEGLMTNGIYAGALFILVVYYFTGHYFKRLFERPASNF